MENLQKEFVPYELALRLKALGFDEPCFAFYRFGKEFCIKGQHKNTTLAPTIGPTVPTFSQAFRWFREKYDMAHQVTYAGAKGRYNAFTDDWVYDSSGELKEFSYEEAELACLDKLIEICSSK